MIVLNAHLDEEIFACCDRFYRLIQIRGSSPY